MTIETHDFITAVRRYGQYDGVNGTELVAEFAGTVDSDDGETLVFYDNNSFGPYSATVGQWVSWVGQSGGAEAGVDELPDFPPYLPYPVLAVRTGTGDIAASALGGTQDVVVDLDAAMSGTDYVPEVQLLGSPGLIGGHGITGWTVTDADTVTVHLSSAAASSAVTGGVYVAARELG